MNLEDNQNKKQVHSTEYYEILDIQTNAKNQEDTKEKF